MATPTDPTGQATNRKRAHRALTKRLISARRRIVEAFKVIPRERTTVPDVAVTTNATTFYDYDVNPEIITGLQGSIAFVLSDELLSSKTMVAPPAPPADWYYKERIEQPFRQGTITGANQMNRFLDTTTLRETLVVQDIAIQQVLFSPEYNQALNIKYATSWDDITSLKNTTARQVMRVITEGMQAGLSPNDISQDITKRFRVADSSAKRIAFTEVNKAYNDALMRMGDIVAKQAGLVSAIVHESALIPTTRPNHARRHGNVYNTAEQLQWWNTGANRINCHCSVRLVLLDAAGHIVS